MTVAGTRVILAALWHCVMVRAAIVALALVLATAGQAFATPLTITVSGYPDSAPASCPGNVCPNIRSAVALADANPGSTIQLGDSTYPLGLGNGSPVATGYLNITAPMTIVGTATSATSSAGTAIKQTDGQHAVINIPASTSGTVTIRDLEVKGGNATGASEVDGGGIYVGAGSTLALDTVLVTGNSVLASAGLNAGDDGQLARGGGIYSAGTLTLTDSAVVQNHATGGAGGGMGLGGNGGAGDGGGIWSSGSLTITASTVEGNISTGGAGGQSATLGGTGGAGYGGGITQSAGQLQVTNSTIDSNQAVGGAAATPLSNGSTGGAAFGGGLALNNTTATIVSSSIAFNIAAGGASGEVDSTAGNAEGGAIVNFAGTDTFVNSTIAFNHVEADLGLGTASSDSGGGVVAGGTVDLWSSTVYGNYTDGAGTGGNIWNEHAVRLASTVVAGGSAHSSSANCLGSFVTWTDSGNNLEDSGSSSQCGLVGAADHDQLVGMGAAGLDPAGPADHGGPTWTVPLLAGSPALRNGGACADPTHAGAALTTDERGLPRTAPCDIGAYQQQPPAATTAPTITGVPSVERTLSCSQGIWTGDGTLSYAYRWERDGRPIASGTSYVVGLADEGHAITCAVTASGFGSTTATSAPVHIPRPNNLSGIVGVARQTDKVSAGGRTAVTVTCSAAGPCHGTLQISVATRAGKAVAARAKTARAVIGRLTFSLRAGAHAKLPVTLTRRGRAFLKAHKGKLAATLTVTDGGHRASARATLKSAPTMKKRSSRT